MSAPDRRGNGLGGRRWPIARFVAFFLLWLVLAGTGAKDLPVGVLAAIGAAWASQRLVPEARSLPSPVALVVFAVRFFWQSVLGGVQVARIAFDPALPLKTGFVLFRPRLAPGAARDLFSAISSMVPGTLPVGSERDGLQIHTLDSTQPVAAQMADDETRLAGVLGVNIMPSKRGGRRG